MHASPRFLVAGDSGLIVEFADRIDPAVNDEVHALAWAIEKEPIRGVTETVPTYRSLLVVYDPLRMTFEALVREVSGRLQAPGDPVAATPRAVQVPTVYGGQHGPDLEFVARHNRLSIGEVIAIHASVEYRVFMIGFTPGFPYLGGMSSRIAAPRLDTPRTKIPAGSVGIAGNQTGIYPVDSPGGWRLIGRTALRLYDPASHDPVLLRPGDRLRFVPVQAGAEGEP